LQTTRNLRVQPKELNAKLALLESLGKISTEFYMPCHSSTIPQFYVEFESPFIKKAR